MSLPDFSKKVVSYIHGDKKDGNFYKENSGCFWRKLEIYLPNIN